MRSLPRLRAMPLATFERDGLKAALRRAGLPCEDMEQSGPLFWRFDTDDDIPAGFAGLEVHGPDALLLPEPNFYILGAKSFGRDSRFLISNGLEQIRELFTLIGDRTDLNLYATMAGLY